MTELSLEAYLQVQGAFVIFVILIVGWLKNGLEKIRDEVSKLCERMSREETKTDLYHEKKR